jgi:DNA-binding response OmpR family regulator
VGATIRQKSVLLVEDERIVAKDLQRTIERLGYEVIASVASADAAIEAAATRRPDLVLLDIHIKGSRDGVDTAQELRNQFDVPVIFLTAFADEGTIGRARNTEPHGYLIKPVKPDELRAAVEIAFHKHEMESRLRERER